MKDEKITELTEKGKRLAEQMPDPSTALTGSLMSRMVRCNKPSCRRCQKGQGKGHGPICLDRTEDRLSGSKCKRARLRSG